MPRNIVAHSRPPLVTALSVFLALGALIASLAALSLLIPGGFLEPMWQLNPRARPAFSVIGLWAPLLLGVVSAACAVAAVGLWRGRPWGRWLAVALLLINLVGDLVNSLVGIEPRAIVGVPIVLALLALLFTKRVGQFFQVPIGNHAA